MISDKINRVIFFLLILTSFLIPIFFIPNLLLSVQHETSFLFGILIIFSLLLWFIKTLASGKLVVPKPTRQIVLLILPPISYFLSSLLNSFSRKDFFGYSFDINSVGFVFLVFAYTVLIFFNIDSKHKIFYTYFAFLCSSFFTILYVVLRIVFGSGFLSLGVFDSVAQSIVGTWNNTGIFVGASLILSLVTFELAPISRPARIFVVCLVVASFIVLAVINFSMIWGLVLFCVTPLIFFHIFNSNVRQKNFFGKIKYIPVLSSIVFLILIVLLFWGSTFGATLQTKFGVTNLEIRPSFSTTFNIIKRSLELKPYFGTGPDTFVNGWRLWRPDEVIQTIFWNINFTNGVGLLPTYVVTSGLVGFLSWFIFLAYYIYVGVKSLFFHHEDKFIKYIIVSSFFTSLYLWGAMVVYVPSVVVFITTFTFTGLFFSGAIISGVIKTNKITFTEKRSVGFLVSLFLTLAFVGCSVMLYNLQLSLRSLWYYQKGLYSLNSGGDIELSEAYIKKAADTVPYDIYYRALTGIELNRIERLLSDGQGPESVEVLRAKFSNSVSSAINYAMRARNIDPENYLNWVSLGRVYESVSSPELNVKNAFEKGMDAYREALDRDPKNPSILVLLSRLAASHEDFEEARGYANQAIEIKNNYLDAYFVLSQIEIASGNTIEAINAVTSSALLEPNNPAIFFQLGILYYNQQNWSMAINSFERAVALRSDYANAKYYLGLSYEKVGKHDLAITEFEDLSDANPGNSDIQEILDNLISGDPVFKETNNDMVRSGDVLPIEEN